jgi:hypothetical protein
MPAVQLVVGYHDTSKTMSEAVWKQRFARSPRANAIEAGRRFYLARRIVELMVLNPITMYSTFLLRLLPDLVLYARQMSGPAGVIVEREVENVFERYYYSFDSVEHVEYLEKKKLDVQEEIFWSCGELTIADLREREIVYVRQNLDEFETWLLSQIAEPVAKAFRFGMVLESGLLPANIATHDIEPEQPQGNAESVSSFAMFFGTPRAPEPGLGVVIPRDVFGACPWSSSWPRGMDTSWAECGLPEIEPPLMEQIVACAPEEGARYALVQNFAGFAIEHVVLVDTGAVTIRDRLLIADESTRVCILDGVRFSIKDKKAFLVLKALLENPLNQLSSEQLQELPGCKGKTKISKVLAELPADLRKLVDAGQGRNAVYELVLPEFAQSSRSHG